MALVKHLNQAGQVAGNMGRAAQPFWADFSAHFESVELGQLLGLFRRRKEIIIGLFLFGIVAAIVFSVLQTSLFSASVVMQVNTRTSQVMDMEAVVTGLPRDPAAFQSELDIIKSRHIAGRVVDRLKLTETTEFSEAGQVGWLTSIKRFFIGLIIPPTVEEESAIAQKKHMQVVNKVLENLSIGTTPRSYTIKLGFTAQNPKLAATIANTWADEYLNDQLETKFEATKRANDWLNTRINELREKVRESEMAVQQFREKNNLLTGVGGATLNDQQLAELNTQLILARTERAQNEARLKGVRGMGGSEASVDVLSSPLIVRLREQEAEVLRRESDIASRYGPKHPRMITVRSEMRDLRQKIREEIDRVVKGMENEVEVARTREAELEKSMQGLQGNRGENSRAGVELAALEREMKANQSLFESFLSRFKEVSEQQTFANADARIISAAEPPLAPSYPNKGLLIVLGAVLGLAAGIGLALLLEMLDQGIRTVESLEKLTGLRNFGMLPMVAKDENILTMPYEKPNAIYVESLRSIRTSLMSVRPGNPPKRIVITSSVPEEGKTTFSITFARLLAKAGNRVLLVDCDLRRSVVLSLMNITAEKTLTEFIHNQASEKEIIYTDAPTGLHVAGGRQNTTNAQELLANPVFKNWLDKVQNEYDFVVIDTPPIMAVADVMMLKSNADAVIFIARWDHTARTLVQNAVKQLNLTDVPVVGTVLSAINLKKQSYYGYGGYGNYYGRYRDYYAA